MANNRKPKNKRGVLTRTQFNQIAPEPQFITIEGEKYENPKFGGFRRILHSITPKFYPNIWGFNPNNFVNQT